MHIYYVSCGHLHSSSRPTKSCQSHKGQLQIMERYPNLFWTPCATHCIDLMLEDIGKIPLVRDIVYI